MDTYRTIFWLYGQNVKYVYRKDDTDFFCILGRKYLFIIGSCRWDWGILLCYVKCIYIWCDFILFESNKITLFPRKKNYNEYKWVPNRENGDNNIDLKKNHT